MMNREKAGACHRPFGLLDDLKGGERKGIKHLIIIIKIKQTKAIAYMQS